MSVYIMALCIHIYIYIVLLFPDSVSYWGSYFKYRKSCMCIFEPDAGGCRCCVRLGAWVLVPLQGVAAVCACQLERWCRCRVCVRLGCVTVCTWELGRWFGALGGWCHCKVSLEGAAALPRVL